MRSAPRRIVDEYENRDRFLAQRRGEVEAATRELERVPQRR